MLAFLFVFISLAISFEAGAVPLPKCPTGNGSVTAQSRLVHKIVMMGVESRELVSEFQQRRNAHRPANERIDFEKKFAATGILNCGGAKATAQLSGAADIITTAGHSFYGPNCVEWKSDGRCTFETAGQTVDLDMASIRGACPNEDSRVDWAVARLKSPIQGVLPYSIPEQDWSLNEDTSIVQVIASNRENFRNGNQSKTVEECKIRNVAPSSAKFAASHDCDTDKWASGSGQLHADTFTLISIHISGRNKTGGDYAFPATRNDSVPLNGQFLSELRRAVDASKALKAKPPQQTASSGI